MKKIFLVFSFLAVLVFAASPSYALKGIDDPVPGTDFIVPFVVGMGGTGLDTSVLIQEISDNAAFGATEAKAAGKIHWYLYSNKSAELVDRVITYSGGDVVPISIRVLITDNCTAADLTAMEYDLDGDGTNDHYVGYFYGRNLSTAIATDNLYVMFQFVDLLAGKASGSHAAMREWIAADGSAVVPTGNSVASGYHYEQLARANSTGPGTEPATFLAAANTTATDYEVFTPAAYFWSAYRERKTDTGVLATNGYTDAVMATIAGRLNFIRFTPRFYLHDASGESYIIIWKNRNHIGTAAAPLANKITVFCWNATETRISKSLTLPNELNIIRIRDILPPTFYTTYPSGGWIDIAIADAGVGFTSGYLENWRYTEFLMWTWTFASDSAASLNWATMWNDVQIGTLGAYPRPEA